MLECFDVCEQQLHAAFIANPQDTAGLAPAVDLVLTRCVGAGLSRMAGMLIVIALAVFEQDYPFIGFKFTLVVQVGLAVGPPLNLHEYII